MFDSLRPHRRQPPRFPRPWDSPGKTALPYYLTINESEENHTLKPPTQFHLRFLGPGDDHPARSPVLVSVSSPTGSNSFRLNCYHEGEGRFGAQNTYMQILWKQDYSHLSWKQLQKKETAAPVPKKYLE